jgi:hypothetical protein
MKKHIVINKIAFLLAIIVTIVTLVSCNKDKDKDNVMECHVTTKDIINIFPNSATGHGSIEYVGNAVPYTKGKGLIISTNISYLQIKSHTYHDEPILWNGIDWACYVYTYETVSPKATVFYPDEYSLDKYFIVHLYDLKPHTIYYVRAFAHVAWDSEFKSSRSVGDVYENEIYVYGEIKEFTTPDATN